jgi:hypothetical protein
MPRAAKPIVLTENPRKRKAADPIRPLQVSEVRAIGRDTSLEGNAEAIDPNKPPTEKQKLFAKLWAQGESIVTAAARAGYEGCATYGYRLVRQPNILAIYNDEKLKYEEAAQMTRKKVMDMLLESYEAAKMVSEPASMVSAAREIGKMCGYYEPVTRKLDITVNGNVINDRLNRMSDAEILDFITKGDALQLENDE